MTLGLGFWSGAANVENEDGVLVVLNEDIQKIKTLLPELREEERKRKNQEEIEKAESLRRRKEGPAVKEARATNERESRGEEGNNYLKTSAVRNKKTFESHHRKLTILSTIFYYDANDKWRILLVVHVVICVLLSLFDLYPVLLSNVLAIIVLPLLTCHSSIIVVAV